MQLTLTRLCLPSIFTRSPECLQQQRTAFARPPPSPNEHSGRLKVLPLSMDVLLGQLLSEVLDMARSLGLRLSRGLLAAAPSQEVQLEASASARPLQASLRHRASSLPSLAPWWFQLLAESRRSRSCKHQASFNGWQLKVLQAFAMETLWSESGPQW